MKMGTPMDTESGHDFPKSDTALEHAAETRRGSVFSMLGMPYVLPSYPDKRGPIVTFNAALSQQAGDKCEVAEVTGTKVQFGLVLHRPVGMSQDQRPRQSVAWIISEPTTGLRVVWGCTRQDALDVLAERVAFYGGEPAFLKALEQGIQNAQELRRRPPI